MTYQEKLKVAEEALAILSPIPTNQFIIDFFTDGESKCCAVGHLVRSISSEPTNYSEYNCIDLAERHPVRCLFIDGKDIIYANNIGFEGRPHGKPSVMAFLKRYIEINNI